jgi:hypothetical protein
MTLNQIELAIFRRTNYADSPTADVKTRIDQWINIWHQRILARPGLEPLRNTTLTFASTANTSTYALPQSVARVLTISDRTTPITLRQESLMFIRQSDPQLINTGMPELWAPVSWTMVAQQPATTGVWVVSTSASDTAQTAYIEGLRTGGYRSGQISVTLNGTTRAALGTFTDYLELEKAYLSAVGVGVISFYDAAAAGNELARISIGQTSARYQTIQLWPTPQSAITYYIDCDRVVEDLVNATDTPQLPEPFHSVLVEAGCYEEWLRKSDVRASSALKAMEQGLNDCKHWLLNNPSYSPVMGGPALQPSRLGGMYPRWR